MLNDKIGNLKDDVELRRVTFKGSSLQAASQQNPSGAEYPLKFTPVNSADWSPEQKIIHQLHIGLWIFYL